MFSDAEISCIDSQPEHKSDFIYESNNSFLLYFFIKYLLHEWLIGKVCRKINKSPLTQSMFWYTNLKC